jgi:hypothetical protein
VLSPKAEYVVLGVGLNYVSAGAAMKRIYWGLMAVDVDERRDQPCRQLIELFRFSFDSAGTR